MTAENTLPSPTPVNWDLTKTADALPFGIDTDGGPVFFDWDVDANLLIVGGSGTGKTVAAQNLVTAALIHGHDVSVGDPAKLGADYRYAQPWLTSLATDEYSVSARLDTIYATVRARQKLLTENGVNEHSDLPVGIRPDRIVLILDEFTSLILPEVLPELNEGSTDAEHIERASIETSNNAKRKISTLLGRIAREGRAAGVTIILVNQRLHTDVISSIPGGIDLKQNMSRLVLGASSPGQLQSALRNPAAAPDLGDRPPRGRGLYETSNSAPTEIQVWHDDDHRESMHKQLQENVVTR